jgi:hypothetical protein
MGDINIESIAAIAAIFGTLSTAIVTLFLAKTQSRSDDRRTSIDEQRADKEQQFAGVEAAERLSNITIQYTQQMYSQLTDCISSKQAAELELKQMKEELLTKTLRNRQVASNMRNILNEHERVATANGQLDCPGFEIINNLIRSIADELDGEAQQ